MADISLHHRFETPFAGTVTALNALNEVFTTWRRRNKARRELAALDHRAIRDLGFSPGEIRFEANKPFWVA